MANEEIPSGYTDVPADQVPADVLAQVQEIPPPVSNVTHVTSSPEPNPLASGYTEVPLDQVPQDVQDAANAGGNEADPVAELDVASLNQMVQNKQFDPGDWLEKHPEDFRNPEKFNKLARVFDSNKEFTLKSWLGTAETPDPNVWQMFKNITKKGAQSVGSLLKGAATQAQNIVSPISAVPLVISGEATPKQAAQFVQKSYGEIGAAMESSVSGLVEAAEKAGKKVLGTEVGKVSQRDINERFLEHMAKRQLGKERAEGGGPMMQAIGGYVLEDLKNAGMGVDPERVGELAGADPFTLYLFGKAMGGIGRVVPPEIAAGAEKAASATAKQVIGRPLQAGGAVAEAGGKTLGAAAPAATPLAALGAAVSTGSVYPLAGAFAGKTLGVTKGVKAVADKLAGAGKAVKEFGAQVAGEGVPGVSARTTRAVLDAIPAYMGELAKGAGIDFMFAATAETPQEAEAMPAFAFGLSALHGAPRAVKTWAVRQQVNPEFWRNPGEWGKPIEADKAAFPSLAAVHEMAMADADPQVQQRVYATLNFLNKADGGNRRAYLLPADETRAVTALVQAGLTPEQASQLYRQRGAFVKSGLRDANGNPQTAVIFNKPSAAPHEITHAIQAIMGEAASEAMNMKAFEAYHELWDNIGQNYTRLEVGDEAYQQKIHDKANYPRGWRDILGEAVGGDKANYEADKYIARELVAENADTLFRSGKLTGQRQGIPDTIARMITDLMGKGAFVTAPTVELGYTPKAPLMDEIQARLTQGKALPPAVEPAKRVPSAPESPAGRGAAGDFAGKLADELAGVRGQETAARLLGKLAGVIRDGIGAIIDYRAAPDDPSGALSSNRTTRRAIVEAWRNMPEETRKLWSRQLFPFRVERRGEGVVQVIGWAPEVLAANAQKLAAWMLETGFNSPVELDPNTRSFTAKGWNDLYSVIQTYVKNQMAGRTGEGQPLVVPENVKAAGYYTPELGEAAGTLTKAQSDFANLLFNMRLPETTRITKGKLPLNVAGQEVSIATAGGPQRLEVPFRPRGQYQGEAAKKLGIEGRSVLEVNALRNEMEAHAKKTGVAFPSLIEAIQRLNLEHMADVTPAPELPTLRGNTLTLEAGFLPPKERTPFLDRLRDVADILSSPALSPVEMLDGIRRAITDTWETPEVAPKAPTTPKLVEAAPEAPRELTQAEKIERAIRETNRPEPGTIKGREGNVIDVQFLPKDFEGDALDEVRNFKGPFGGAGTGKAFDIASKLETPEQVEGYYQAAKAAQVRGRELMKAGNLMEAMREALRAQFYRETFEAATNSGSSATILKRLPDFKPKFPELAKSAYEEPGALEVQSMPRMPAGEWEPKRTGRKEVRELVAPKYKPPGARTEGGKMLEKAGFKWEFSEGERYGVLRLSDPTGQEFSLVEFHKSADPANEGWIDMILSEPRRDAEGKAMYANLHLGLNTFKEAVAHLRDQGVEYVRGHIVNPWSINLWKKTFGDNSRYLVDGFPATTNEAWDAASKYLNTFDVVDIPSVDASGTITPELQLLPSRLKGNLKVKEETKIPQTWEESLAGGPILFRDGWIDPQGVYHALVEGQHVHEFWADKYLSEQPGAEKFRARKESGDATAVEQLYEKGWARFVPFATDSAMVNNIAGQPLTSAQRSALVKWGDTAEGLKKIVFDNGSAYDTIWSSKAAEKPAERFAAESVTRFRALPDYEALPPEEERKIPGGVVSHPRPSYAVASKTAGNPWVRMTDAPDNTGRVLAVQFTSDLLNKPGMKEVGPSERAAEGYYNKLYSGAREGYARMDDFWEIPTWIGQVAKSFPETDMYVVRNMEEAIKFFNEAKYDQLAFSSMDINEGYIKQIAEGYKGKIAVGGYGDKNYFKDNPNVRWFDSVKDMAASSGKTYVPGEVSFRHFQGSDSIPRLQLSKGCKHKCAFCAVVKKIEETPAEIVNQQADEIAKLGTQLVYLNDKTFGQASNYKMLADVFTRIKSQNPKFKGFVIQTTASELVKGLPEEWLKRSGIRYVELGIESYNDPILNEMHKPATTSLMDRATEKLRKLGIALIPNIIIGFPQETEQTYQNTLDFLKRNDDIISHANIYNLGIMRDTELAKKIVIAGEQDYNENVAEKSFHTNPEVHRVAAGKLYGQAEQRLERPSIVEGEGRQIDQAVIESLPPKRGILGTIDPVTGEVQGRETTDLASEAQTHGTFGLRWGINWRYSPEDKKLFWWESNDMITPELKDGVKSWLNEQGYDVQRQAYVYTPGNKELQSVRTEMHGGRSDLLPPAGEPQKIEDMTELWPEAAAAEDVTRRKEVRPEAAGAEDVTRRKETLPEAAMLPPKKAEREARLTMKEIPIGRSRAWITPDGEVVQLGSKFHHDWLYENPAVVKKFSVKLPEYSENDTNESRVAALTKGFARVSYDANTGAMTVEARRKDWAPLKDIVEALVSRNLDNVDSLRVNLLDEKAQRAEQTDASRFFTMESDSEKLANIPFITKPELAAQRGAAGIAPESVTRFRALPEAEYLPPEKNKEFGKLLEQLRSGKLEGASVDYQGNRWEPEDPEVFLVSLAAKNVKTKDLTPKTFAEFRDRYIDIAQDPNVVAGLYTFKNNPGVVSIDLNFVVPKELKDLAKKFGKENNQFSIWDQAKGKEIRVGGTGNTRIRTPEQAKAALDALIKGEEPDINKITGETLPKQIQLEIEVPVQSTYNRAVIQEMNQAELKDHFPEAIVPRKWGEPIDLELQKAPLLEGAFTEEEKVSRYAKKLEDFYNEVKSDPDVVFAKDWYNRVTPFIKKTFGKYATIFTELLAATSPNSKVADNVRYSHRILARYKAGDFKRNIAGYLDGLKALEDGRAKELYDADLAAGKVTDPPETPSNATYMAQWIEHYDLAPRDISGKLFGMHTARVLQVLSRRWFAKDADRGPKVTQFVKNLLGIDDGATIDVWAGRTMRRLGYEDAGGRWRILPDNAKAISDPDFLFSQAAFAGAAKELGMKPSELQAALWFAEKKVWAERGWGDLDLGDFYTEFKKQAGEAESRLKQSKAQGMLFDIEPRKE